MVQGLLIAVVLLMPALLFAGAAWKSWNDALREGEATTLNAVSVVSNSVRSQIKIEELALQVVADRLYTMTWDEIASEATSAYLTQVADSLDNISILWVADDSGEIRAASKAVLLGRHITERKVIDADASRAIYVSATFVPGLSTPASLVVIYPSRPGALLRGTLGAVFSNGVLDRLFANAAPVAHSSLLITADGTILARDRNHKDATQHITADDPLMRRIAEQPLGGIFSAPLSPGTRDELLSYGQVPGLPIWVAEGVDRDVITARWRSSLQVYGLVAAIVSLALLLVSWLAIGRARAEQAAVLQLNTETKQRLEAERRLRTAYRLEAVGQLAGGVAHDFNNLLYVVSGNLELISNATATNDRIRTLVERAADAVARGSRLVASLLAFGQRQMLQTISLDINHRIAEFLPLIQLGVGDRIELALHLDPTLPLCKTNPEQLEAALLNVAINARDAMEGQGALTIATRCTDLDREQLADNTEAAPGQFIAISLSDTGSGMSPEVAERAFEPFFTTKDIGQGTGLGLSQVFGFIRQLGGHVTIKSTLGSGTVVTLFLPQT